MIKVHRYFLAFIAQQHFNQPNIDLIWPIYQTFISLLFQNMTICTTIARLRQRDLLSWGLRRRRDECSINQKWMTSIKSPWCTYYTVLLLLFIKYPPIHRSNTAQSYLSILQPRRHNLWLLLYLISLSSLFVVITLSNHHHHQLCMSSSWLLSWSNV